MATLRTVLTRASALVTASMLVLAPVATAQPDPAAMDANTCPYRVATPPAVDASEIPEVGDPPA
ncbi:D-alanyl-D-alanine carboxypeptidase, partial [Mycobacterium sp. ITM-2017-0098]